MPKVRLKALAMENSLPYPIWRAISAQRPVGLVQQGGGVAIRVCVR